MKNLTLSLLLLPLFGTTSFATTPLTELTNANFDSVIARSPLAVVDFNAKWCGASARFRNVLLDFAHDNPTVDVYSVDVDAEPELTADFNVSVYPTTYVFRYGKRVYGFSGVGSESFLVNKINSH
jgi:thioredoxin 1